MKHLNIQPKPIKFRGVIHVGKNYEGSTYNAETSKNTIRIWGFESNNVHGGYKFDRTFKIDDVVEHDSYNYHYVGPIVKIGPKTVTVKSEHGNGNVRLNLFDFIRRNRNLDLKKIEHDNHETSMCI